MVQICRYMSCVIKSLLETLLNKIPHRCTIVPPWSSSDLISLEGELEMSNLRKQLNESESVTRDREHDGSNLLQQLHQYKQQLHSLDEQLTAVQEDAAQVQYDVIARIFVG